MHVTDPVTLSARWVLTAAGPPLAGTVTVADGLIQRVDPAGVVAPTRDLGDVALLPGLVNAHTHLDLTGAAGRTPPSPDEPFPDWLLRVIAFRRSRPADEVTADVKRGIELLAASGTTAVGDISSDGGSLPLLAADGRVRGVVFRESIGLAPARAAGAHGRVRLARRRPEGRSRPPRVEPARAVRAGRPLVRALAHVARVQGLPVCMHVAESPAEEELLTRRTGPFVAFLQSVGAWHPDALAADYSDVLADLSPAPRLLLAHGNYVPDPPPGVTVVYCPRTHAAFGHPPHPLAGRVCLGTDSLASNPDLDVLAEARFLHRLRPDIPGETLLAMVTRNGAEALGLLDVCGSIEPGKAAEFAVVAVDPAERDGYAAIFAQASGGR